MDRIGKVDAIRGALDMKIEGAHSRSRTWFVFIVESMATLLKGDAVS